MNIRNYGVVSMPYIGLPPFLHFEKFFENWELKDCVNALYRASPISTAHMKISQQQAEMCQCPISGFPHFYPFDPIDCFFREGCVNALYRASPISTLSLQKPFKINGFRGRFQGVIVRKF